MFTASALTELALAREREALSAARLEATQRELASLRGRTLELEAERDRIRITRTSSDRLDRYYTKSKSRFIGDCIALFYSSKCYPLHYSK